MPLEVVKILFELTMKGTIKFDREIKEWFEIGTFDQFEPTL